MCSSNEIDSNALVMLRVSHVGYCPIETLHTCYSLVLISISCVGMMVFLYFIVGEKAHNYKLKIYGFNTTLDSAWKLGIGRSITYGILINDFIGREAGWCRHTISILVVDM